MRAPALASLAAALLAATPAVADPPATLPWSVQARDGRVVAAVDLGPALPPDLPRLLGNGLNHVVTVHVALVPDGGEVPVALFVRELDVLYDVWDEAYRVTVKDPETPRGRDRTFGRTEDLRTFLADARGLDLGPVRELGEARWVLTTRLEVNPVSKELLQRTRDFIADPAGRPGAQSRSVLGAMAGYLLRPAEGGSDVHLFRSPPFSARDLVGR